MYKHLSHLYDTLDEFRTETRDKLLDCIPDGNGMALDVGTGTGIGALKLKIKGYSVDAIDNSSSMIQVAQAKDPDIHWQVEDIITYHSIKKYKVILCATNVLNHFITPNELKAVIIKLHSLLDSDGILAFDILKPSSFLNNPSEFEYNELTIKNLVDSNTQKAYQSVTKDNQTDTTIVKIWDVFLVYALLRVCEWKTIELKESPLSHIFIAQR